MSEMTLPQATDHETAAPISRVRYDVRPEDVLDQGTLDDIARKQDEADGKVLVGAGVLMGLAVPGRVGS